MKLYIIRHGETDWNAKKWLQGGSETTLNENGRKLAILTGQALQEVQFHKVYSSPLKRAMETARLVIGNRDIEIIPEPRIREISFGIYEGKSYHPDHMEVPKEMIDAFFHHPEDYPVPEQGESIDEIIARTHDFYKALVQDKTLADANILISAHGCAVRALEQSLDTSKGFWREGVPKNCAVTIAEIVNGEVVSVAWDQIFYE